MARSLVIIGGGIAGLAAGCYARMNGFDVDVHEMHTLPGGLCTAWTRGGYTIDLCIDWLCGSSPGTSLYPVWEELGIIQGRTFLDPEYYTVAIGQDGERFTVWTDMDRLREEMLRIAPLDRAFIDRFCRDLRGMQRLDMPVDPGIGDLLRMLPALHLFRRYAMPVPELAGRIENPVLRDLFESALDWHGQSAAFVMIMLALMARKAAGYPLGGSLPVARTLEARFCSLGGVIHYRSRVAEVIVEGDRASGVILEDGSRVPADIVLSAADGHSTLFQWIPEKYLTDQVRRHYRELQPFPPILFFSIGVAGDCGDIPRSAAFRLKEPVAIAGKTHTSLTVMNRSHDPSLAPTGKSVLSMMVETDFTYWERIPYHSDEYLEEKSRIEEELLDALEHAFPGLMDRVEMTDLATPHTFVRYTGNWKGSYEGWLLTKESMNLTLPQVLPDLSSFYLAGQWVTPGGGLPGAALSARKAVQRICRDEGRRFVTTKA